MCKLDKSFNTGIKSYSFLHWKCLARKPWTWVELRPIRTIWFDQPPVGGVQTGQLKRRRASDAPSSLFSSSGALTLLNMAWTSLKLRFPFSRLRPTTRAGPLDPRLGNQPFMGLRLCQSRNGATNSTIAEGSFPGDVTQPSQISTREQPKEPELNTWRPKQRTHAGNETNASSLL